MERQGTLSVNDNCKIWPDNCQAMKLRSLLLQSHFVMEVERGVLFLARWRSAAKVSGVADDFVAEWLAGERVDRQRHGNVGEFRGQRAIVLGGVEAQCLDVSQKRDPLVESPLCPAGRGEDRHGSSANSAGGFFNLFWAVERFDLPEGKVYGFHDVVEANLKLPLLIQEDHLVGREPQQPLLREAVFDEALAGGA